MIILLTKGLPGESVFLLKNEKHFFMSVRKFRTVFTKTQKKHNKSKQFLINEPNE